MSIPSIRTPAKLLQFVKAEKGGAPVVDLWIDGEMGDDEPLRQARANLRAAFAELEIARATGYCKSYAEYAATYDTDADSIKHWVHCGKLVRVLSPLDDPRNSEIDILVT